MGPGNGERGFNCRLASGVDQPVEDLRGDVLVVAGAGEVRVDRRRLGGAADDEVGGVRALQRRDKEAKAARGLARSGS